MTPVPYKQWRDNRLKVFNAFNQHVQCDCDGGVFIEEGCTPYHCGLCDGNGSYYECRSQGINVSPPALSISDYRKSVLTDFVTLSRWTGKSHYKQAKQFLDHINKYIGQ